MTIAARVQCLTDQFLVTTEPSALHMVKDALEAKGFRATEAAIEWIPKNTVRVEGKDAESLVKLLEALEDLDDVQKVEGNFDIPEDAMAPDRGPYNPLRGRDGHGRDDSAGGAVNWCRRPGARELR